MRGLAVVDAKSIQKHQGLLKSSSAQNHIRLSAAGAALLDKNRRVLPQQILLRLQRKHLCFHWQHQHGCRRLR
jgi:hypothetical protein